MVPHQRIHAIIPNAKLILILRNPITRAFSAYNPYKIQKIPLIYRGNNIFKNFNDIVSSKALVLEEIRFFSDGFYVNQIENLYKYFLPNQILILISEQMKVNPEEN